MLSPDDASLAGRDPALSGLPLLLDDDALGGLLGAPVRRRYLRYKPGTACVLALDVAGQRAFAVAHSAASRPKLDKTVTAAREGTVLAVDRGRGLLVARPAADRDLPGVAHLAADVRHTLSGLLPGTDLAGARLTTLSHKPQRRWVGRLAPREADPVVVRVHRPADARARHDAARALAGTAPWLPSLLGTDARRGISVLSWLDGTGLDGLLERGWWDDGQLRATGARIAALHERPLAGALHLRNRTADGTDLRRAAAAVAALVPELAARSTELADRLSAALDDGRPPAVACHGDLSPDQVLVLDDGDIGLVDLDAATGAEAAFDLGSLVAALHTSTVLGRGPADPEGTAARVLDGYRRPVDAHRVRTHAAAGLLRRAAEPFRLCVPRWRERVGELVRLAEVTCPERVHR